MDACIIYAHVTFLAVLSDHVSMISSITALLIWIPRNNMKRFFLSREASWTTNSQEANNSSKGTVLTAPLALALLLGRPLTRVVLHCGHLQNTGRPAVGTRELPTPPAIDTHAWVAVGMDQ